MDDSDLLAFAPVSLRGRRDGWTAKKQYFFILALARGDRPGAAAKLVGMSRKSAYQLRGRPGAEGFAAAWRAAAERARERRFASRGPSLAERALHGEWHPRLYRGRLIGWTHKPASMRTMGLLKRLDRQAQRLPPGTDVANYHRFFAGRATEGDSSGMNAPHRASFLSPFAAGTRSGKEG